MNQFIFCAIVDGQISYGLFKARSGSHAREFLEERYKGRKIQKLEFKGITSSTFDFDVVGGIIVDETATTR